MTRTSKLSQLRELERLLTMENAGFGFAVEKVTVHASMGGVEQTLSVDEFIKERTRIWRESWPLPIIRDLIEREEAAVAKRKTRRG